MSFSVQYVCQGQQKSPSVSLSGDEISISTAIAAEATEVTNIGVIPNNIAEVVIYSDVDCTVDCGTNSPSTITGGQIMVWSTGCGLTAPFAGASLASFTIVSTDAVNAGTVEIMVKTTNS